VNREQEFFKLDHLSPKTKVLDVGCGEQKKVPWAVGIDRVATAAADVVHDLDRTPWPFDADSFEVVVAAQVIEHVADLPGFFAELHRICRPGAEIRLATPHYTSPDSHADPTHRHGLAYRTFEFFADAPDGNALPAAQRWANRLLGLEATVAGWYGCPRFELVERRITFRKLHRLVGVDRLAAHLPLFYEYFLGGFAPARDLQVVLRVRK
jgi:SAM-dependent methyltransferase